MQEAVYDDFVARVAAATAGLRQGPALGGGMVDCGALCMPGLAEKVHALVQDAVHKGAKARVVALNVLNYVCLQRCALWLAGCCDWLVVGHLAVVSNVSWHTSLVPTPSFPTAP